MSENAFGEYFLDKKRIFPLDEVAGALTNLEQVGISFRQQIENYFRQQGISPNDVSVEATLRVRTKRPILHSFEGLSVSDERQAAVLAITNGYGNDIDLITGSHEATFKHHPGEGRETTVTLPFKFQPIDPFIGLSDVIVSQNFARQHGLETGQIVTILAINGVV